MKEPESSQEKKVYKLEKAMNSFAIEHLRVSTQKSQKNCKRKWRRICVPDTAHRILEISRLQSCEFEYPNIRVHTEPLYGYDSRKNTWHEVGAFISGINVREGDIWWRNKTRTITISSHPNHVATIYAPCIASSGKTRDGCLGSAAKPFADALRGLRFDVLIAIAIRFPECPRDARGSHVGGMCGFPEVPREQVPRWYLETFEKK